VATGRSTRHPSTGVPYQAARAGTTSGRVLIVPDRDPEALQAPCAELVLGA